MPSDFMLLELFRLDATMACAAALGVCLLILWTRPWHGSFSMDDVIGVQKMHAAPTPRIGGVAIAFGVLVGFAASSQDLAASEKRHILSTIILAGIPAFVFGLLEDLTKRVSVRARLLATMASGLLGWGITGVSVSAVAIPGIDWLLGFTAVSVLFTAFAVGGMANAVNIIDGFNGLAAGAVLIMLGAFGLVARSVDDIPLAFSCLVLAGAVLGFLLVNWPLGKIFLGDGGAYFLGFALAWISVLLPHRNPTISPWTSLLILAYPVLEVVFSYLRRVRRNSHPGQPDRMHLHHLLHTRVARKLLPELPQRLQNGLTSSMIWALIAVPSGLAILTAARPRWALVAMGLSAVMYGALYRRLARFRW